MSGPRRDASVDRLADLYDRFAATLFRHGAMILADRAAAADMVHNVFLRLAKARSGGDVASLAYVRRAVHLKVWEGMTFQEIAHLTGESLNTAASRYRYAIEKLRQTFCDKV
jgi:DNA-directed RNA polymerase specialized sigma24 family protein